MNSTELVVRVIEVLESLGIPFMVVGSFSSNVYGIPRSTKDADFVVQLGNHSVANIANGLGQDFILDAQAAFETVTGTTKFILTHRDSEFVVELFCLSQDPHDLERFARRLKGNIGSKAAYVPTAEDVIITKLRWSRHANRKKDIDDVKGVVEVQGESLDLVYIRRWTDQHGTRSLLEKLLSAGSPSE